LACDAPNVFGGRSLPVQVWRAYSAPTNPLAGFGKGKGRIRIDRGRDRGKGKLG